MTGIAFVQGCDFDMSVVVQRQAPMAQTVLGGSAVTVRRQGHRDSCLNAERDPSGAEDAEDHRESTVAVH